MEITWQKLCAMGCSILYVIIFLFCPFLVFSAIGEAVVGFTGTGLLSGIGDIGIWPLLPLLSGIAMAVCALVTPGKVGGIVCSVGAAIPLITFYLLQGMIFSYSNFNYSYMPGLRMTMGAGVIVPMILGAGAAVLCFLSGAQARPKERTAGFSAGEDDEW